MNPIDDTSNSSEQIQAAANQTAAASASALNQEAKQVDVAASKNEEEDEEVDIETLLVNSPTLQASFDTSVATAKSAEVTTKQLVTYTEVMRTMMKSCQVLQQLSAIYANQLVKITEEINVYSDMMNALGYVSEDQFKGFTGNRNDVNTQLQGLTEKARINKDKQSGYAQSTTTFMQNLKDASTGFEDLISTQIQLWVDLGRKIT